MGRMSELYAERVEAAEPRGPHSEMTIDEIQARYSELGTEIETALEEQHRLCEELMNRAEKKIKP